MKKKTFWVNIHRLWLPGIAAVLALLLVISYLLPNKVLDTYAMNLSSEEDEEEMLALPEGSIITYSMNTGKRPLRGIQPGIGSSGAYFEAGQLRYRVYRQGEEEPVSDNVYALSELNGALQDASAVSREAFLEPKYIYLPFDNYEACKGEIRIEFSYENPAGGEAAGRETPLLAVNQVKKEGTSTQSDGRELEGGLVGYTVYTHNTYPLVYDLRILVFLFLAAAAASPFYPRTGGSGKILRRALFVCKKDWMKYAGLTGIGILLAVSAEFLFFHALLPAGSSIGHDNITAEQGTAGQKIYALSGLSGVKVDYQVQNGRKKLTEKEQNSILVKRENAKILAELNGMAYAEPADETLVETEEGLYRKVKRNIFHVTLEEPVYINKLLIECPAMLNGTDVLITIENEGDSITLAEAYMDERLHAGSYRIGRTLDSFRVTLSNEQVIEEAGVRLLLDNTVPWNSYRMCFLFAVFFLSGFFILNKDWFLQYPERVFVLTALLIGGVLIYATGTNQTGYDEHIHFAAAYNRSFLTTVETTESAMQAEAGTFPPFTNAAERSMVEAYAQDNHDYGRANITSQSWFPAYDVRSYLPLSFGLWLGRAASLPFEWCVMLARFCNLLVYTALGYAAVKASLQGKVLVAAAALLPNYLFAACVFTYDGIVNGFLLLAVVLTTNQLLTEKQRITWVHALFIVGAFVAGSTAKAIYILMALTLLFFGREKFGSRLRELLFKVSAAAICMLLLYTVFFPPVSASGNYELIGNLAYAGDKRTQGTSVLGQISYIAGHPVFYTKLLLTSMAGDLFSYLAGRRQFLNYGYLGGLPVLFTWLGAAALVLPALFAPAGEKRRALGFRYRTLYGTMIFGVSAVVWTSMYISFNAVGNSTIEGVQGRYFLPLFLPFLYCLMNGRYTVKLGREAYAKIVLGLFAGMNLFAVGMLALKICM